MMHSKNFRKWFVVLLLLLVTILLLWFRPQHKLELKTLVATPVVVDRAERVQLKPVETVSGHLQPVRRVTLQFQVAGLIAKRFVEPGVKVEEGQELLELEAGDYQDTVIQARASWQQEEDNLARDRRLLQLAIRNRKLQEEEVERLNSLRARSLASKTRIGEAEALLATRLSEEARLRSSVAIGPQRIISQKAVLDSAERNLQRTKLRAPFAGRVNDVLVNAGDYAAATQKVLELIDERLDFSAFVRGEVARSLQLQDKVKVYVGADELVAEVVAVQPDPDPATFTHAIRLRMPEQETRSGISARAVLSLQPLDDVLAIPVTAVLQEEGTAFVFKVVDEHLQRVPVQLGDRIDQQQVILEGLSAGEPIVVRDVAALADGQVVVIDKNQTSQ